MAAWYEPQMGGFAPRADCVAQILADIGTYMTTNPDGTMGFDVDGFMALAATRLAAIPDPSDPFVYNSPDALRSADVRPMVERLLADLGAIDSNNGPGSLDLQPHLDELKVLSDKVTEYYGRLHGDLLDDLLAQALTPGELGDNMPPLDDTSTETRYYRTTFVSDWEEEGAPSEVSEAVEVGSKDKVTITVGTIPGGRNLAHWRAYRSNSGNEAAAYQYVRGTEDLGTPVATGTLEDDVPNSELGEVCPSTIWNEPPSNLGGLIALPNQMHLGYFGNTLCPTVAGKPWAYPQDARLTVGYPVVGMAPFGHTAIITTRGTPYYLDGVDTGNLVARKIEDEQACVSARSIVTTSKGVAYASPDGMCLATPAGVSVLTRNHFTREDWQRQYPTSCIAAEHDGVLFMLLPDAQPPGAADSVFTNTSKPLLLWLDAADTATLTITGGKVSQWNDKSGNARHGVQATDSLRGTIDTTHFAPGAVKIPGIGGYSLQGSPIAAKTALTVFLVVHWTATTSFYSSVGLADGQIHVAARQCTIYSTTSPSALQSGGIQCVTTTGGGANLSTNNNNIVTTGKHLFQFFLPAVVANGKLIMDGVELASTATGAAWDYSFTILCNQSTYAARDNHVAEALVYDGALTTGERAAITAALETKWSL